MLERVGARASRRCPAPAPGVRGAPGSSQHAKCSVGPAGEQVELSASPRRPAASPTRLSALADGALRSRHETSGSGAPALLSAAASTTRSRLESGPERLPWVRRHDHDSGVADAPRARAACAQPQRAAYQLGHNAARTISASHLWHPFGVVDVPPSCAVGGGAGGVGDSSKRNRRQASHFPECGEVNG